VTPDQMSEAVKIIAGGIVTLLAGWAIACATFWAKYPEMRAGVRKTEVETDALEIKTMSDMADYVYGLQEQVSSVQRELARLSVENARLLVENINLSAKNAALEEKVAVQATEIAELKRRVEDAEVRVAQAGRAMTDGAH
jgi:regulator of replication initiation timing